MNLESRKYTAFEKIMLLNENEMEKLEQFLDRFLKEDVSIDQYNREIEEADIAIDRGDYVEHEDAIKKLKSWRSK